MLIGLTPLRARWLLARGGDLRIGGGRLLTAEAEDRLEGSHRGAPPVESEDVPIETYPSRYTCRCSADNTAVDATPPHSRVTVVIQA